MEIKLYNWQENCLTKWQENSYKGIAHVTTGAGKTILAIEGSKRLNAQLNDSLIVYVIVPKTALKKQWKASLERSDLDDIIIWSNAKRKTGKYTIITINTAREILPLLIEKNMKEKKSVLLILDEVHHYGSPANSHIFDFKTSKYFENSSYYSLGLTATKESKYFKSVIIPNVGKIFFNYSINNALSEKIVNDFIIFNVSVSFDEEKASLYSALSNSLSICFAKIYKKFPIIQKANLPFYELIQYLRDRKCFELSDNLETLTRARRDLIISCDARLDAAIEIIKATDGKTIVFSERIEQVEALKERLDNLHIRSIVYQSLMEQREKDRSLTDFYDNNARILLCCKALDEGLDVPDCDIAIVLSCTSTKLQRVQRIGRVIRKAPGKLPSTLYYIHVDNTVEDMDYLRSISKNGKIPIANITYANSQMYDSFYAKQVLDVLQANKMNMDTNQKNLFKNLINIGAIRMERFLDEKTLKELIEQKRGNTALYKFFLLMKRNENSDKETT